VHAQAATPLLTCTDVRNMSADIKRILTNPEVLEVHKDPLARMATRVDIGGGTNELRSSNLCPAQWPACQEGPGDPNYPGHPCTTCRSSWSVHEKPLHDNSSAVMVLNRGETRLNVPVSLRDLGDSSQGTWAVRDIWSRSELGVFTNQMALAVPAHGVRMLRMRPLPPTPPPPPPTCPSGYTAHAPGLWSNPSPCGYPAKAGCREDAVNITLALCAKKCDLTRGCLAFEVYEGGGAGGKRCFTFVDELKLPFISVASCFNCVKNNRSAPLPLPPSRRQLQLLASKDVPALSGFKLGNGTFVLNGEPMRLFTGALQHFRIHPAHWAHRLALARAMGLNSVQTLIPWMMMEPRPGEFKTDGFVDIVKFAQMAQKQGLLIVLRLGPFICDGPDWGGFPWWLAKQNTAATMNPATPGALLRVRTADPAFLHRVDLFYSKVFTLLREAKLTAGLGGPIIMAQVDNEYGLFGTDQAYLQHLRRSWRQGLGEGVVIHSTDPADAHALGASRTPGVLQTVDFATTSDPATTFGILRASQRHSSSIPQPLMVSEFYPGYITAVGQRRLPIIYPPAMVAAQLDKVLNTTHCGGSTSFALWLFAGCTDFGFWGGTLFGLLGGIDLGDSLQQLTPSYDVGAPVDAAGVVRPLFHLLQAVLKRHGANVSTELPPQPPVSGYGPVTMKQRIPLWRALPALEPNPVRSETVRTMEELDQGYGYILYSAPVPQFEAPVAAPSLALAGMRDRALVYLDQQLYQTCHRGKAVDSVVCSAAAAKVNHSTHLDILVENQGRVTGGLQGTELPFRGISRYVALDNQILANWTITPLPLNDTSLLAPLWSAGDAVRVDGPAFFRGQFSIGAGKIADTWLTLFGWREGAAFINGQSALPPTCLPAKLTRCL
jgi:beta-galactosidase